MSTRGELIIVSGDLSIRFYKHCDGYPTAVLDDLSSVLGKEQSDLNALGELVLALAEEGVTYEVIKKGKTTSMYADVSSSCDLEWSYVVNLDTKLVAVFEADYGSSYEMLRKGVYTDPYDYVTQLRDECQEEERDYIKKSIDTLTSLGFGINKPFGEEKPKEKAKDIISVVKIDKNNRFQIDIKSFSKAEEAEKYFIKLAEEDSSNFATSEDKEFLIEAYLGDGFIEGNEFDLLLVHNELV